jgi:CheY-like chemotaxis protein
MPHILLIEDNEHQRRIMRERLQAEGYQVTDTPFGNEGVELAKRLHPDLAIIDIMVPNMDGWEVMKALQADETTRDMPYVVLSGAKAMPQDVERSMSLGAQAHFAKGVTPMDEMLLEIRLMLGLSKVLLLDGNIQRANEIREALQKHRFLVTQLAIGGDAVNRFSRIKPDLFILSNAITGMTPLIVLQRIRSIPGNDRLPILFLTEGEIPPTLKGVYEPKKLTYPCTQDQLLHEVQKALGKED